MKKKYYSTSQISLSVALPKGKSTRISFRPLTGGGSVYYTDKETIQEALEKHLRYGKLFFMEELKEESEEEQHTNKDNATSKKVVKVTDLEDAKNYLVDKHGVSRTKLRYKSNILDTANELGVVFVGLE